MPMLLPPRGLWTLEYLFRSMAVLFGPQNRRRPTCGHGLVVIKQPQNRAIARAAEVQLGAAPRWTKESTSWGLLRPQPAREARDAEPLPGLRDGDGRRTALRS